MWREHYTSVHANSHSASEGRRMPAPLRIGERVLVGHMHHGRRAHPESVDGDAVHLRSAHSFPGGKTTFQSSFMLMTVQPPCFAAFSEALSGSA